MQTSKNPSTKPNRSLNGDKKTAVPQPSAAIPDETYDLIAPLGQAIRQISCYGEMLVENIEGLTYYQKAKELISELFLNSVTFNTRGEMSDEYKNLHLELHHGIQSLLDAIHKEYCESIRERNRRIYEAIAKKPLEPNTSKK